MKKEMTRFGLFALVASLAVMTGCDYNNNDKNQQNGKKQNQQQMQKSDQDNGKHNGNHYNGCCS